MINTTNKIIISHGGLCGTHNKKNASDCHREKRLGKKISVRRRMRETYTTKEFNGEKTIL